MGGLFIGSPAPVPAPPAPAWTGLGMTWTGWDGTVWDLSTTQSGLIMARGGVRGLTQPAADRFTQDSPALDGTFYRGSKVREREAFWPIFVFGDSSQEWLEHDRAFWRTMHPRRTGLWTVEQPNGDQRTLGLRFVDDGDHEYERDPFTTGWSLYGVTLVAEQPYWLGAPITRAWGQRDSVNYYGGGAWPTTDPGPFYGPPFYVTSSSSMSSATVPNPGDESAWPVWTLWGPFTTAYVGVAGSLVQVPFSLSAGQWLVIDTNPTAQTAVRGTALIGGAGDDADRPNLATGTDVTQNLGSVRFAPIPASDSANLSISMVGNGRIDVAIRPRYLRAW